MTENKPIIIDGVDVSKCKHYEVTSFYCCNETCTIDGGIVCTYCKDNPNCYFKQLACKTQECQQLINKNNRLEEELNATKLLLEGKNNQYAAKTQECEELKHQIEVLARQLENANKEVINEKEKNATLRQKKEQVEKKLERIKEICKDYCKKYPARKR